jgi:hypothetical protein
MAISIFPVAVTSTGPNNYSSTIATAMYQYKASQSLSAGIYTITTAPTSSQATVKFYDSDGIDFATATTISGALTYNLGTAASGYYIQTNTGTNIIVGLTLIGVSVSGTILSGTLDTITTSGTYNQTGLMYVLAVAGGGGGSGTGSTGAGMNTSWSGGKGGSITSAFLKPTEATTVTIGAQGNGGTSYSSGNIGGATSFGNLLTATFAGGNANGGTGPTTDRSGNGGVGTIVSSSIIPGSNAGGSGAGYYPGQDIAGVAGGFGTGGRGGAGSDQAPGNATAGGAATGYGAGGGAAGFSNPGNPGGAGSPGVIYVLRGI